MKALMRAARLAAIASAARRAGFAAIGLTRKHPPSARDARQRRHRDRLCPGRGQAACRARHDLELIPSRLTTLPNVGYFRQLGAEGVLSLKPDLILAATLAGPPEALKQIAGTGVTIVSMPESFTPDGLLRKVETIANALGVPEKGATLAAELKREADAAKALIAARCRASPRCCSSSPRAAAHRWRQARTPAPMRW